MNLIKEAKQVYESNFSKKTNFERAIFFSYSCNINDCKFCYMSTKKNFDQHILRSTESILAETIITKCLGWDVGFVSGGIGALTTEEMKLLLQRITEITKKQVWINIGVIGENKLQEFKPYIKGVVGTLECVNKELHDFICPSKPVPALELMFEKAQKAGVARGLTIIVGLGETKKDFQNLKEFIIKHNITKIHIYSLNPVRGTYFETVPAPSKEYHAWWIAKTRKEFPKIDIQAGIWKNKTSHVEILLKAGANSISKFPAIRSFGKKESVQLEEQAKLAGRKFSGSLKELPGVDVEKELLNVEPELRTKTREKLEQYLGIMKQNLLVVT